MNDRPDIPQHALEDRRLQILQRYQILDTLPEQAYDDITLLASQICDAPISLISLVDEGRQWFKSRLGIDITQTSREVSFCAHAIQKPQEMMVVPDALLDPRFSENPFVTSGPQARFYAGAPLTTPEGVALGTLCVIDTAPRDLTPAQTKALSALARQVMAQLELHYRTIIAESDSNEHQQAMLSAQHLARQVHDLYDNAPCGYHSLNQEGCLILINDTELDWLGYTREEVLEKPFTQLLSPHHHELFAEHLRYIVEKGEARDREFEMLRKDGTTFPILINDSIVRDDTGKFLLTRSASFDVSDLKKATTELRASEARFEAFMDNGPGVTFIKDANGCYVYANKQFFKRFALSSAEVLGRCDSELWPADIYQPIRNHDLSVLEGDAVVEVEEVIPSPDGHSTVWLSYKFPLDDGNGKKFLAGVSIDITQRKKNERQLEEYRSKLEEAVARLEVTATTDFLTGLKNHGAFMTRLPEEISRHERYNVPVSLLLMDVDDFKKFNDSFGHPAGDEVLRQVGRILQLHARPSDLAARYGGEEFAVILSNTSQVGAFVVAERIRAAIESENWPLRPITVSIGVAEISGAYPTAASLVNAADTALYNAKHDGKNQTRVAK